jgi:hypothetical protein
LRRHFFRQSCRSLRTPICAKRKTNSAAISTNRPDGGNTREWPAYFSAYGRLSGVFSRTANCQSKQFPATALRIAAEARGMTRDETIALFLECEAKRVEALAGGKSEDEAHLAAMRHWNAWAEPLLAERKALEADDRWRAKHYYNYIEPQNEVTRDCLSRAKADFRFCLFLNKVGGNEEKGAEAKAALNEKAVDAKCEIVLIPVDNRTTRFEGFVFPWKLDGSSPAMTTERRRYLNGASSVLS